MARLRSSLRRYRILGNRTGDCMRELFAESSGFDGEPDTLEAAPFANCSRDSCVAGIERGGRNWRLLATRSSAWLDWEELVRSCAAADIVVSDRRLPRGCEPRWLKLDRFSLRRTGGIAIYLNGEPRVLTVAERVGQHPWGTSPR